MVAKQAIPTEERAAREALAAAITEAARRILADYTDEQLLSKPQVRWVATVKRAVRAELGARHPALLEQISARRLGQLVTERVTNEVRKHQFAAFERELTALYGPLDVGDEYPPPDITGPINGVYVVQVQAPSPDAARQDKAWSADD